MGNEFLPEILDERVATLKNPTKQNAFSKADKRTVGSSSLSSKFFFLALNLGGICHMDPSVKSTDQQEKRNVYK